MKNNSTYSHSLRNFILFQAGLLVMLAIISRFIWNVAVALSLFSGGMIAVIANSYFSWRFFAYSGARSAKKIIRTVYYAEAVKIMIIAALFLFEIKYLHVRILPLFIGFIVIQTTFWLAPLFMDLSGKN